MSRDFDADANEIYTSFCEMGGIDFEQFETAWNAYQDTHGDIENGSIVEQLIIAAMRFAIVNFAERLEDDQILREKEQDPELTAYVRQYAPSYWVR